MRKATVIDCYGHLIKDPTSYGYQWDLNLHTDDSKEVAAFEKCVKDQRGKVKVRIEIMEVEDEQ